MFVSVVLGLAITAQAIAIALSLLADTGVRSGVGSAAQTRSGVRTGRGMQLGAITAAHLFGVPPQALTAANARAVSRTPLVLTGIIASPDPHDGYAIIGASASRSRAIYVGSEAAPGTVLTEVHAQWVVLERAGQRLTLRLPHNELTAMAGGPGGYSMLPREPDTAEADDGSVSGPGPQDFSPPPLSDGAAVVRAFALRPTNVDGEQGERIIGTGLNGKVLASLGLSPGDVITSINGVSVGARNAPNLLSAIQSGSATLVVVKDGEQSSVTLDPSSLADAAAHYREMNPD